MTGNRMQYVPALRRHVAAIAIALVAFCPAASAQNFPHTVRLIVPYPAGGPVDLLGRAIAPRLGEVLGQPVVIENRLGAGGNIGVEMVAKAKPDGYTLLVSPGTIATNVAVYRKLPYDLLKDLQTVVQHVPLGMFLRTLSNCRQGA